VIKEKRLQMLSEYWKGPIWQP